MADRPSHIGPYRLVDSLGHGGMGVVYRAVDETTGRPVAIKTVRVPKRVLLAGIRREIHALARLDHPGIVRILGDGFEHGLPWYAMDLVDGRPLFRPGAGGGTWWTDAQGSVTDHRPLDTPDRWLDPTDVGETPDAGPFTAVLGEGAAARGARRRRAGRGAGQRVASAKQLASSLTVVRRLCSALAYLHGEGLVHRDLKPANILLRNDGMPIIVDFGLTARFGDALSRETLVVESSAGGTAAYMAPEQILGEQVDARADLYSLGCMLYQLVTGRKPFAAPTMDALLQKHLTATPIAPSALVDGIPIELDELILRLLEKRAERRLGHADDVAAALVKLGATASMPVAAPASRAYLYRPRLCGRHVELEELERHLSGVLLVSGESGVGKTRLAVELGRRAARKGALVLSGECLPSQIDGPSRSGGTESALMPIRPALREMCDICREGGLDMTERVFGRHGPVLALYEPAIASLPGQDAYAAPSELPATAAVDRLFDALTTSISGLASTRRVVVILDDLQWADELTLDFLNAAASRRVFDRASVLVVGTYRAEEVDNPTAGQKRLRALVDRPEPAQLEIGRVDSATVEEIVGQMLALQPPPQGFSEFLSRQSEGNPFFVAEYLRAAVAEGVLYRTDDGVWRVRGTASAESPSQTARLSSEASWENLELPGSVRDLVLRRLEALDTKTRRLVGAAAVLGREIDVSLLSAVAGLSRKRTMESLHELLRRQVLEEPGPGLARFVHDKIREVAYERLKPTRRKRLHRVAAEQLELLDAQGDADLVVALGSHWQAADEPIRARSYDLRAARLLWSRHAFGQSEALYRRYLARADRPSAEAVDARNELGANVLLINGSSADALAEHLEALVDARALGDRGAEARTLQMAAAAHRLLGQYGDARARTEEALAIYRDVGDERGEGQALAFLGAILHYHEGKRPEAQEHYEEALVLLRSSSDRHTEGTTLANYGDLLRSSGDSSGARALIGRAIEIHASIGALAAEGSARMTLAILEAGEGNYAEAGPKIHEALAVCRAAGYRRYEGIGLFNLAFLAVTMGRHDEAKTYLEEALVIQRQTGHRRFEGVTLGSLAAIHHVRAEMAAAWELYEQSLAIHREVGNRQFEGETLAEMGQWKFDSGAMDDARRLLFESIPIHRETKNTRYVGISMLRIAAAYRTEGRLDEAETTLAEAEEILREIGEPLLLVIALCERGHLTLAIGAPANDLLAEAHEHFRDTGASGESDAGRALSRLERAVEADRTARSLANGEPR